MTDIEKFKGRKSGLRPGSLPGFLTQFGLNLASATPSGTGFGGLAATAAKAAQSPFQTFQAAKLAEREDRADRAEDLFSGALASEYDILEAEKKGGSSTQYAKSQAADALGKIYETDIANVQAKIDKLDPTADADMIKEYEAEIQGLKRQLKTDQKAIFLGADTDQEYQREVIETGLELFEKLYGYRAKFFIPTNGPFNNLLEPIAKKNGINYLTELTSSYVEVNSSIQNLINNK